MEVVLKCRGCLSEEEEMHYLYNEFDQGLSLRDILKSTTGFEVLDDDKFSSYLCQNCTTIVVDFYNFKTIYNQNENNPKDATTLSVEDECQPPEEEPAEEILSIKGLEKDFIIIKVEGDNKNPDTTDSDTEKDLPFQEVHLEVIPDPLNYGLAQDDDSQISFDLQADTYPCPECGESFSTRQKLKDHSNSEHKSGKIKYEEFVAAELTCVRINGSELQRKCKICNSLFDNQEEYKQHVETHKTHICDICGMGFSRKAYLKDHLEVHFPDKRHVCCFCNKAFKRRTVMVKHKKIHTHPRQCVCEICGRAFNDKGTLKTHIMLLHLKTRKYECGICGERFPLKATLEKHVTRHENKDRQYFCTNCPLRYKDKSSLDRHFYVKHSGLNLKSQCGDCGRKYATMSGLAKHQRIYHQNPTTKNEDSIIIKSDDDGSL